MFSYQKQYDVVSACKNKNFWSQKEAMNLSPPFLDRASQVADYLRRQIQAGQWRDHFPAERILAEQLGVSRRSLGAALAELTREGILENEGRAGRRVVKSISRRKGRSMPLSVGVVVPQSNRDIRGESLYLLDEMRKVFEARQIRMELHRTSYLAGETVGTRFKKLIMETRHAGWMLISPTEVMQQWCRLNEVPAMIYGMGGEHLPSISVDYRALCRHAVGECVRRGHRRLALILPQNEKIEDLASREGFLEGLEMSPHADVTYVFEHHDTTTHGVCLLADRLLNRSEMPSVWLVCRSGHFFTIFSHLLRKGVRIPEDVSLICRGSGEHINDLVPDPARYEVNYKTFAKRCVRLAIRVIEGQNKNSCLRIMPEFLAGETLGSVLLDPK